MEESKAKIDMKAKTEELPEASKQGLALVPRDFRGSRDTAT